MLCVVCGIRSLWKASGACMVEANKQTDKQITEKCNGQEEPRPSALFVRVHQLEKLHVHELYLLLCSCSLSCNSFPIAHHVPFFVFAPVFTPGEWSHISHRMEQLWDTHSKIQLSVDLSWPPSVAGTQMYFDHVASLWGESPSSWLSTLRVNNCSHVRLMSRFSRVSCQRARLVSLSSFL